MSVNILISLFPQDCKRVLDYLAVAEVIESLEDLVQFVRDLSPCLAKVVGDVFLARISLM
jgi:hypothetical protein